MLDQNLYSDVPPTKLRNVKETFIKAGNEPFWVWLADKYLFGMLENAFYSLRIKVIFQ